MISFFRKIRQKLLNEGKTSRYFKYAIGEVLLVVIGILIALQLNNWNEQKKQNVEELKMLRNLQLEIQTDLKEFEWSQIVHSSTPKSIDRILYFFENDLAYDESLKYDFHRPTRFWFPKINNSVYQALKSQGLDLISNDELSKDITSYYSYASASYEIKISEYRKIITDGNKEILSQRFGTLWNGDYSAYRKTQNYDDFKGYMIPNDFEALKKDNKFKFYLSSLKNQLYWYIERPIDTASKMAKQLNTDIENELRARN